MSVIQAPPLTPTANGRLYDLCWVLANRVSAAVTNPPEFLYVASGRIAYDFGFECVAAEWTHVRPGPVGQGGVVEPIKTATQYTVDITVTVLRGVPTIDDAGNVDVNAIQASAQLIDADTWQIITAVHDQAENWTLAGQAREVAIVGVDPIDPQGGVGGTMVHLEVEV